MPIYTKEQTSRPKTLILNGNQNLYILLRRWPRPLYWHRRGSGWVSLNNCARHQLSGKKKGATFSVTMMWCDYQFKKRCIKMKMEYICIQTQVQHWNTTYINKKEKITVPPFQYCWSSFWMFLTLIPHFVPMTTPPGHAKGDSSSVYVIGTQLDT